MFRLNKMLLVFFATALMIQSNCSQKAPTPLETAADDVLTSYPDMMTFFNDLEIEKRNFTIDTVGTSVQGRSLLLLHFEDPNQETSGKRSKLKVLLYAQQHGDEPSGKEAAIALARDISTGIFTDILQNIELYLIPQVNPDGAEKQQRLNANEIDLNRDHLTLTQPEIVCLHEVFQSIMPEVTLDIHEYGVGSRAWVDAGMHKNFGSQMGSISNPNISMALRSYTWNRVFPYVERQIRQNSVKFQRYLVVGDPGARFRFSTTALNDGRNSFGIYNTLSFILEGQKDSTVEGNLRERTRQQLETIKSFLTFFSENAGEAKRLVYEERNKLTGEATSSGVPIIMDYVKDPARPTVTVDVIELATERVTNKTFENFYPLVQSTLSVQRPRAYAVPAEMTEIVEILKRHNITVNPLIENIRAAVETYKIIGVKLTEIEDKEILEVDVDAASRVTTIPAGYHIVWCNQIQTNLIVTLLEPQSMWGLAPRKEFSSLLRVGSNYPILRIMRVLE